MVWAKLDDAFPVNRKVRPLSDAAFRHHVSAICWAAQNLTDGCIPEDELHIVSDVRDPADATDELLRRSLWHKPGHACERCPEVHQGWVIHDFLAYHLPADEVRTKRELDAERKRQARHRRLAADAASVGLSARTTPMSTLDTGHVRVDDPVDSPPPVQTDAARVQPDMADVRVDDPADSPARARGGVARARGPSRPVPSYNDDDPRAHAREPDPTTTPTPESSSSSSNSDVHPKIALLANALAAEFGPGTNWSKVSSLEAEQIATVIDDHGLPAAIAVCRVASAGWTQPPAWPSIWLAAIRGLRNTKPHDQQPDTPKIRCAIHDQWFDPTTDTCHGCATQDDPDPPAPDSQSKLSPAALSAIASARAALSAPTEDAPF